ALAEGYQTPSKALAEGYQTPSKALAEGYQTPSKALAEKHEVNGNLSSANLKTPILIADELELAFPHDPQESNPSSVEIAGRTVVSTKCEPEKLRSNGEEGMGDIGGRGSVRGKGEEGGKGETLHPIPYAEIISALNARTGSAYRASTEATRRRIRARWAEGFRLEDFLQVIDKKAADWGHDPKMARYLRPETLFGTKFEGYLQERQALGGEDYAIYDI
ncbi:conserved phage C-terminal domain-containing protein, partial [Collinsella sp. AGMB00827]